MLPPTIPIFPLPDAVLFPHVFLPLHIFEPRYREMVADAIAGDRIIGMTLLQPGFEVAYEGRPSIYSVGCAGVITHSEVLSEGRYNIVVRGIEKFRVLGEDQSRSYRLAQIEAIPESLTGDARTLMRQQRQRLEAVLVAAVERSGSEPRFPPAVGDEDLVNALAKYLAFEPVERQALLECEGVLARCSALIELLEMKTLAPPGMNWKGRAIH